MAVPSNWYENFFSGLALDLWRKAISPEQTKAEADFITDSLGCPAGAHLLDVPCGNGRLSFELARRAYRVTGVDISDEFIAEARSLIAAGLPDPSADADGTNQVRSLMAAGSPDLSVEANESHPTRRVEFILGDMRFIEGEAIYDGAYCFGNSFSFLEYSDMEKFLNGVARALKPGARFVIESGMAAESIVPKFEPEASHQIEDIQVTIREQYLAEESCIDSEYIFECDGKIESRKAKHWIYTVSEIRRMLERAGFVINDVLGSLDRKPYELGSTELFVVAQRA